MMLSLHEYHHDYKKIQKVSNKTKKINILMIFLSSSLLFRVDAKSSDIIGIHGSISLK